LLWEDDEGGSACQGEAKGSLGKGKGIAGESFFYGGENK
jgi:hypothetical protein